MAIFVYFQTPVQKVNEVRTLAVKRTKLFNFNLNRSVCLICYDFQTIMTPNGM